MRIQITIGTTSWSACPVGDPAPGTVLFEGDFLYAADTFTANMVWDDGLQNVRPMTDQEIAQRDADRQAATDRESKIQAAMRAQAEAIVDGQTDPAVIVAAATQAIAAVQASPAVKVKP